MNDKETIMSNNKLLLILSVFLLVIIIIQGIYLFRANKKLASVKDKLAATKEQPVETAPQLEARVREEWDPIAEIEQVRKEINNIFDQSLVRAFRSPQFKNFYSGRVFTPDVDVSETDQAYVVKMDIAGLEEGDFTVEIMNGLLVITGQRKTEGQQREEGQYYRGERNYGYFSRSIPLPEDIDTDKFTTTYDKGVLTITVPKSKTGQTEEKPEEPKQQTGSQTEDATTIEQ
jgi:HSP20 family protein